MAQERPSKIREWLSVVRQNLPELRQRAAESLEAARAEPQLVVQHPAFRYSLYGVAGLILVLVARWGMAFIAPPPPPGGTAERAVTADFHVMCTAPDCGHHFVINRQFGFDDFPVACPKCQRETGAHATRCLSNKCKGRWVVPDYPSGGGAVCPVCGASLSE